ncbi:MAG: RodZ domain-containing protein [Gammaproteobacteria bacterium]
MSQPPETEASGAVSSAPAPGEILRRAREGKGLSVAAIATQLNLDLRTVEALERGEQDKLPALIFVRGYLRGYARLVGVPEDQVVEGYQAPIPPPAPAPRAGGIGGRRLRPAYRAAPAIPWRGLLLIGVLVAVSALAFLYGPRWVAPLLTGAPAETEPDGGGLALPLPGGADVYLPPSGAAGGLALPLPEPRPIPAEEPPVPADAEPEPNLPGAAEFDPELGAAPAMPVPPPAALPVPVRLEFRFEDDSWVEVRGADRARLLFGLMRKGGTRSVLGVPPVSVLLGNAAAVELRVDGKLFEHAGYIRGNTARFEVGTQS